MLKAATTTKDKLSDEKIIQLCNAAKAGNEVEVRRLIEVEKVPVESIHPEYKTTPALWAAQGGHLEILKIFLEENQANIKAKSLDDGNSIMHFAAYSGNIDMLIYLQEKRVEGVAYDTKDNKGNMPLSCVKTRKTKDFLQARLNEIEQGHKTVTQSRKRASPTPTELLPSQSQQKLARVDEKPSSAGSFSALPASTLPSFMDRLQEMLLEEAIERSNVTWAQQGMSLMPFEFFSSPSQPNSVRVDDKPSTANSFLNRTMEIAPPSFSISQEVPQSLQPKQFEKETASPLFINETSFYFKGKR